MLEEKAKGGHKTITIVKAKDTTITISLTEK